MAEAARLMGRRSVAGTILVAWVGALAWLAGREYRQRAGGPGSLEDVSRNIPPGSMFYQLSVGGSQLGFASTTLDTVPEGLVTDDRLIMAMPILGEIHRTQARAVSYLNRTLQLSHFEASLRGDAGTFTATGTVTEDSLSVEFGQDDRFERVQLPMDDQTIHQVSLPLRLPVGVRLESGAAWSINTFDPLSFQRRDVSVRVLAESTLIVPDSARFDSTAVRWVAARWDTVHAWKVQQRVGALSLDAWIDDYGVVVQANSPMGFEMSRTAFEIAYYNLGLGDEIDDSPGPGGDVIHRTAIGADATLSPTELAELSIRLGGADLSGFALGGGRQTLSGDTLTIRREAADDLRGGYRLPSADTLTPYLQAEPLIQSDDPRVQAQARQIVGRRPWAGQAARRLNEWVHREVQKQVTIGIPSALHVLSTLQGDCNEHTVVFVALARAIGLPARTAAGLVYVNGRFYYHAWPEVLLTEWVPVDPTFGQFPADAAHLRFTVGGLARHVELVRLIGRLTLDVVRAEE